MTRLSIVLVLTAFVSACGSWSVGRYSVSTDNVVALRNLGGKTLNIGAFTTTEVEPGQIDCRAVGPVKTLDGETFAEFIRKAMLDELRIANVYSSSATTTITGHLDAIDFSSQNGYWDIRLTVTTSFGKSMTVSERYEFSTGLYSNDAMCQQTSQAFVPAVQNLIGKVVRSPEFISLVAK